MTSFLILRTFQAILKFSHLELVLSSTTTNDRDLMMVVIDCFPTQISNLLRYFTPNSLLFLNLKSYFSLFFFFFLSIFLFNLPLQSISYGLLVIFLLLDQDRLFISALKYCSLLFELNIKSAFEDFASGHDLRKIHLCLHCIVMHRCWNSLIVNIECTLRLTVYFISNEELTLQLTILQIDFCLNS